MHDKKQNNSSISSLDNADQRIQQVDWSKALS